MHPQARILNNCTRRFDPETNLLYPSKAQFLQRPSKLASLALHILSVLGLVELTTHAKDGSILETTNLTIFNVLLVRFGPMNEKRLNQLLIITQVNLEVSFANLIRSDSIPRKKVAGSIVAFVVRYGLAGLVYDGDRR